MLRENLIEKIGSLIIAIVLVLYVQSQLHPTVERTYEVPIELLNAPAGYEVRLEGSPRVRITLRGVKEVVENTSADRLRATIDLRNAKPGENFLPLSLQYPPAWEGALTVQAERQRVKVFIEPRLARQMPVRVRLSGTPEVREVLAEALTEPLSVRVSGAISEVRRVQEVQAPFDLTGLQGDMEVDITPMAVDSAGNPVLSVQLNPSVVRLKLRLIPQPTVKTVPVSPRLGELPPFPYRIAWFAVEPVAVQVRGNPSRLKEVNVIETAPISLRQVTRDTTLKVALEVPRGLEVLGAREVEVQVRIERLTPEPARSKPPEPPTSQEPPPTQPN
ncbi:MAG: CdaR family protein [Armatimonadota bacterium]